MTKAGPAVWLLALLCFSFPAAAVTYLSADDFLASSFDETVPTPQMLWLTPEIQNDAKRILGHTYRGLRVRYWSAGARSAWILDEIGKERPITMGIVVNDGQLGRIEILEYREPRGGEVRHPFFTEQFNGLTLNEDWQLNGEIDGISGATLSVRAVTNIGRFALYLHETVNDAS